MVLKDNPLDRHLGHFSADIVLLMELFWTMKKQSSDFSPSKFSSLSLISKDIQKKSNFFELIDKRPLITCSYPPLRSDADSEDELGRPIFSETADASDLL